MRFELIVWAAVALLLMAAEAIAPGVFLLWLGVAAAIVFLVLLVVPDLPVIWQAILYGVLAFLLVWMSMRYFQGKEQESDQPLLNRRGEQLVGQVHVLEQAIVNGRGRLKIGDAFWAAEGEDMPEGIRVRVIGAHGGALQVRPVE